MRSADLSIGVDGAQYFPEVLSQEQAAELAEQLEPLIGDRPGRRLFGVWDSLLGANGAVGRIASDLIGPLAKPVRIVAFDKTSSSNWSVGWHQDRTIAVRERKAVEGFGPWSTKDGTPHVAPPISVLEAMVTLCLHLDDCEADNAPLKVALGSQRLGFIAADRAAEIAQNLTVYTCHAQAGDVWAYSTPILHASERSRTEVHRRVLQIDYSAQCLPGGLEWAVG